MAYNFSHLKTRTEEIASWLKGEFSALRTGRATPAVLDTVRVESYGTKMPVNQIGNVGVEDAKTLRISPWDMSQIENIQKGIQDADLGLSVNVDDTGLRVSFPELTVERRDALIKLAKQKHEEARVSLRGARDETWDTIQSQEKESELTEDEKFRAKEDMQKIIDEANTRFDEMLERKEAEIQN